MKDEKGRKEELRIPDKIVSPLCDWFSEHARTLPWREDPSPYRVWISEIMLQQTRVEAVKPYFDRFMKELPDISALADCPDDKLLKLWEGLGYYNRARNLKKAAIKIREEYDGIMPADISLLLSLPGIGPYTAGAVSSIAYGEKEAAVDGNVLRVLTRLLADDTDIMKNSFREDAAKALKKIMPEGKSGLFNQALMELGALVCVPNGEPKCAECPWEKFCRAHAEGREGDFPVKTKAKARKIEDKTVLVIRDGDRIVLRKRPPKGLLAGLYEYPSETGHLSEKEVLKRVEDYGFLPLYIEPLDEAKHIFSHVEWHMTGFLVRVAQTDRAPEGLLLVNKEETERDYPVPAAYAAYMKAMNIEIGLRENLYRRKPE